MPALDAATSQAGISEVHALAGAEMEQVDALIRRRLGSEVALINQISEHIVAAGGKRLRPMLTVIAARALGYAGDSHFQLAAIIEFIHTSTLLHDDVVDDSDLRRGRKTANALWGNAPSVLVGDFLYSRSFQLMVELDSLPVMRVLADATNQISEGEVLQLLHIGNPDTTEADYLKVISRKTAVLFAAATRLSAMLAGASPQVQQDLADFGMNLGMAFQIADDVLDYTADAAVLGKNLGDDLAEGKATLPVIHALSKANPDVRERLATIIADCDVNAMGQVLDAIKQNGSLAYSRQMAGHYARAAEANLAALPDNRWTRALHALARYSIDRQN